MDFAIAYNAFAADMSWRPVASIENNVWLSLNIRRGSFFAAPDFGLRPLPKKNTARTARLVEAYVREALQWLIAIGRATAIDVTAERDPIAHPNRMLLRGSVTAADGRRVPFERFVEVI
ncbi:MAG: hypothetical protein VR64_20600 [Desulfatitalea sp. BRH_c12]|nr:MAG: hypothetical protein VR64_20600 [Desulfatitalea sp. BRH_c12]